MTGPVLTVEESQRRADLISYATRLAVAWRLPNPYPTLMATDADYHHLPVFSESDGLPGRGDIAMAVDRGWRFSKGMA